MQVGLLTAVPWLTAVAVMYFAARHSDRTGDRVRHAFAGAALSAGSLCTAPFVGNGIAAIALLSVAAAGLHVAMPLFWQLPPRYLPPATMGAGIALINSVGNLSGFVGPYATGALHDATGSFTGGMVFVSGLVLMAAIALLVLDRAGGRAPLDPEPEGAGR